MRWIKAKTCTSLIATAVSFSFGAVGHAQTGTDQTIFNDEGEMVQMDAAQLRQMEGEEQAAEQRAAFDEKQNRNYRLYAEKRVQELEKLKGENSKTDQQISVLQQWLKSDAQVRAQDMATIRSLQQQILNLQKNQQAVMANLGNDVNAMRQDAQNQVATEKFNETMRTNYFNELQTEMGPANWNTPSSQGAYYSMNGIGFGGGRGLW